MTDIGLMMNGLLGVLLVGALFMGWRLESRLKALRASHQSFARAVEDLDRAAARAEQGLADLRAATDEAADSLAGRIERAQHLTGRLEKLTQDAVGAEQRLTALPKAALSRAEPVRASVHGAAPQHQTLHAGPVHAQPPHVETPARPAQSRDNAFARFAERYGHRPVQQQPLSALAEAAARNDLILEDDEVGAPTTSLRPAPSLAPEAAARIERLRQFAQPRAEAGSPQPAPSLNGRGRADDELFEAPVRRAVAGGLR